ncbi:MAG: cytochrome c [Vicinamibacterales bacterium]
MLRVSLLVLLVVLAGGPASAQTAPKGDPVAGAKAWGVAGGRMCTFCHGENAEGGFGPDLAGGRGLTFDLFKKLVRKPYGIMPAYTEQRLPDQMVADIWAFLIAKPAAKELGTWHWRQAPASAPLGQRLYMGTVGCGQCHEPENKFARMWLGEYAKQVDFAYFAKQIYNHEEKWPKGVMPHYSRERLPEAVLREIYQWMVVDIGMRASIGGTLTAGEPREGQTTFTLALENRGIANVGLDAEVLTAFVRVPTGTKVVKAGGVGYTGTQSLAKLGLEPGLRTAPHPHDESGEVVRPKQDLSGDVVVWKLPKLAAGEKTQLTFTIAGAASDALVKGLAGSTVYWEKPGRNHNGRPPTMVYRDLRTPDYGDHEIIAVKVQVPASARTTP